MSENKWHFIKGVFILLILLVSLISIIKNGTVPSDTEMFLGAGILYLMWDR